MTFKTLKLLAAEVLANVNTVHEQNITLKVLTNEKRGGLKVLA